MAQGYEARFPSNEGASRKAILQRDNRICQYCAEPATTIDHVVPRSKGGGQSWTNLASSCHACNSRKGNLLLSQSSLKLRKKPAPPKSPVAWRHAQLLRQHKAQAPQWSKYLQAGAAHLKQAVQ